MGSTGWYDENAHRAYPFADRSVGRAGVAGVGGLPHDAVVGAGFVLGPSARAGATPPPVVLASVSRAGSSVTFAFACDAPGLLGVPLAFTRDLSDPPWSTEHADSDPPAGGCALPSWWGYLTTGPLQALADWLPDGATYTASTGDGVVEPCLVQDLSGGYVEGVSVANTDRTRYTAPAGCAAVTWPFPVGESWVRARCVTGPVRFSAGYNCVVSQDAAGNSVSFGARQAAGAGEPCGGVPLGPGETGAELTGAPGCGDVLRSVNGVGGPDLVIRTATGVAVTADPASHKVTVDVGMQGLASCRDYVRVSEVL